MRSKFKSLLEIREFSVKLLNDLKDLENPKFDFWYKEIFETLKEKGFTKFLSKGSKEYLKNKTLYQRFGNRYHACRVVAEKKKKFTIEAVTFNKVTVEDWTYYVGAVKNRESVMILTPHFFWRYKKRVQRDSLEDAIFHFMNGVVVGLYEEFKVPDSKSGEVLVKFKDGVGFANRTSLGIQGKSVIFFKTFVSNNMLTEEQKAFVNIIPNVQQPIGEANDYDRERKVF